MKYVLAVLAMCLCLGGCQTPPTTSNVLGEYQGGLDDWTVGLDYKLWGNVVSGVEFRSLDSDQLTSSDDSAVDQRPEVRWPSMFDFGPRETPLSFSLAWDLARSNAWDSETKPGSYLDYDVDLDIGEFTPLIRDLFPRHQWDY